MVSAMMLEDCEDLARRGIIITPCEIVRLNSFGLRAERGTVTSGLFNVRRACICGDICFREPTIGHYQWLAEAERIICLEDGETWCYTRAYWLAHADADELVGLDNRRVVERTIGDWANKHLRDKTLRELRACMDYAERGADALTGERGPTREVSHADDDAALDDWCSEIGVVREAQSLGLGIPLKDALNMTHAQLRAVVDRAYERICGADKTAKADAVGDYNAVLEEIVKAHEEVRNG